MVKVSLRQCEKCGKKDIPVRPIADSGEMKYVCAACSRKIKQDSPNQKALSSSRAKSRRKTSPVLQEVSHTRQSSAQSSVTQSSSSSLSTRTSTRSATSSTSTTPRPVAPPRQMRRVSRRVTATLRHIAPNLDIQSIASLRILIVIVGIALLLIGVTLGDHFLVSEWAQYEWARRLGY
ncbi:MAG: hypothetical protein ACFFC7_09675 [Candidatus Hermodarchaeota archaeon]